MPWLGDVPAHWEVKRLKDWVEMNHRHPFGKHRSRLHVRLPGHRGSRHRQTECETRKNSIRCVPLQSQTSRAPGRYNRLHGKDLFESSVACRGRQHRPDSVTGFAVLTPKGDTSPKFVSYVCQSDPFTNRVTAESVGIAYPAIAETRLSTFDVCIPPFSEQAAIVRFLDQADRRIRRDIRAKQKLIALLEEQKQAIIHKAVTGQIDVRTGQPYPAYKPSGVEWLGDVPADWGLVRSSKVLRQSARVQTVPESLGRQDYLADA